MFFNGSIIENIYGKKAIITNILNQNYNVIEISEGIVTDDKYQISLEHMEGQICDVRNQSVYNASECSYTGELPKSLFEKILRLEILSKVGQFYHLFHEKSMSLIPRVLRYPTVEEFMTN